MLELIWAVTIKSLKLTWKYGFRVTISLLVGLTTIFIFLSLGHNDGFSSFIFTVCAIVLGVSLGINLIFGLYIGIYAGLIVYIFQKSLPASKKYRQVIMWGSFASCGLIPYILFLRMEILDGLRETFALILAAYGSWLAARLVDWIEEFGGMLPLEITRVKDEE